MGTAGEEGGWCLCRNSSSGRSLKATCLNREGRGLGAGGFCPWSVPAHGGPHAQGPAVEEALCEVLCLHVSAAPALLPLQRSRWDPQGPLAARDVTASPCSRFSAENGSEPQPEPRSKPPPAHQSPVRRSRAGGDWLGLKDEDFLDAEPSSAVKASPVESQPSPAAARRPRPVSQLPAAEEAAAKPSPPEAEDWLSAALSRKKAQAQAKAQERDGKPSEAPGGGLDCSSPVR